MSRKWVEYVGRTLTSLSDASEDLRGRALARAGDWVEPLIELYGATDGFDSWLRGHIDDVLHHASSGEAADRGRVRAADWLRDPELLAYTAYVDRFGGDFRGLRERIPYLQELGIRLLHLLPFHKARAGDSDGGFAVADYESVDPRFGSDRDFEELLAELKSAEIRLASDFVLNHCSSDHPWAKKARAGNSQFREYFHVIESAEEVRRLESQLGEIFPDTAPGNFTRVESMNGWVWTTFYPYQWDLNWSNPALFAEMAAILLRNASRGIDLFRLDSIPFLWKRRGTECRSLPEAYRIVHSLRAMVDIAAPHVGLLAEAIVPTEELKDYLGSTESAIGCHVAYQSTDMAAGWASIAVESAEPISRCLAGSTQSHLSGRWIRYVRCHDDIGWTVLNSRKSSIGADLASIARSFDRSENPSGYSEGVSFQSRPDLPVHGTCGTTAALCGIQRAEAEDDPTAMEAGLQRFKLLYALAFLLPGVPLIHMGDEIALANAGDGSARVVDTRELQRPRMDWERAADRIDSSTVAGAAFAVVTELRELRASIFDAVQGESIAIRVEGEGNVLVVQWGQVCVVALNFSRQGADVRLPGGEAMKELVGGEFLSDSMQVEPLGLRVAVR